MAIDKADLVLHEGIVFGHPESDSVAIIDGEILAHGKFAELKSMVGPRTHLLKMAGRTVIPGFIDSHLHFMEGAAASTGLTIKSRTINDLLPELRVAAAKTPPGNWLRAFGCDEALMRDGRGPTREELDQAVPKNPLRLRHSTLHGSWLNSRAIAAFGLENPDFKPPDGAMVFTDATGQATGLVVGMEEWITSRLPLVTAAETEARARIYSRDLAAAGVTAFTDTSPRNDAAQVELFGKLSASRSICQRIGVMIGFEHLKSVPEASAAGRATGISIAGAKFIPRGAYEAKALAREVRYAVSMNLDCAFHATEVEELDAALGAIEATQQELGPENADRVAFRIEHGGLIPPNFLSWLRATKAWVVSNPGFIYYRGVKYAGEPGLIPYLYRLKTLREEGIPLAAGSDAPVTPAKPLAAISAAMTRTALEGYSLSPIEKLDLQQAFALFTTSAARLARLRAGAIEPGKLADLVILAKDPVAAKPAELMNVPVDITLVGGRIVYERGRPTIAHSDSADLHSGQ
ncbi:MAG TPA: amidohydrolase family protein [Candidatus Binataceae bacterium]|nr:amidohydrolase family protein [Candidatus Binataceae bacterium]